MFTAAMSIAHQNLGEAILPRKSGRKPLNLAVATIPSFDQKEIHAEVTKVH